ncbi:unnamed protein product [Prorocentrum cordatum]|uniref:Uncharacterized protein n=1 Tax=Prorocentrum cordatum TaxID=2364126 RepID=A0ABN9WWN8_9DINO|nr:unnamed protein product [Polarella glacialis]
MAATATSFEFEGREFPIFTDKQLSGINREALTQRAMNLRDHVGQDRLPPMPRHPEGLVSWVLSVQDALSTGYELEPPPSGRPASRGGGGAGGRGGLSELPTPVSTDTASAYSEARRGGEAARLRNQGGGMAAVFGGQ